MFVFVVVCSIFVSIMTIITVLLLNRLRQYGDALRKDDND